MVTQDKLAERTRVLESKIWNKANGNIEDPNRQMEAELAIGYLRAMLDFMRWAEHGIIILQHIASQLKMLEEDWS